MHESYQTTYCMTRMPGSHIMGKGTTFIRSQVDFLKLKKKPKVRYGNDCLASISARFRQ